MAEYLKEPVQTSTATLDEVRPAGSDAQHVPIPETGKALPVHPEHQTLVREWNYLWSCYKGGHKFKNALGPDGVAIFIAHERETDARRERRKSLAVYNNLCRPIVNEHNAFVFREVVNRDDTNAAFGDWSKDVDRQRTTLHDFIRIAVRRAQVLGRYFVGIDSTKDRPPSDPITVAQAERMKVRYFLRHIDPRNVVNWAEQAGVMTEALVLYDNGTLATLWTATTFQNFYLEDGKVVGSGSLVRHEYGMLPIRRITPFEEGESQIADIAPINARLFNLDALEKDELYNVTFSEHIWIGVSPDDVEKGVTKTGTGLHIAIDNANAKHEMSGSDIGQAESIRTAIREDIQRIYHQAGLRQPDAEKSAPESGIALTMRLHSISTRLGEISAAGERVESEVTQMWADASSQTVKPPTYERDFDKTEFAELLQTTMDIATAPWAAPEFKTASAMEFMEDYQRNATSADRAAWKKFCDEYFARQVERSKALETLRAQAGALLDEGDGESTNNGEGNDESMVSAGDGGRRPAVLT